MRGSIVAMVDGEGVGEDVDVDVKRFFLALGVLAGGGGTRVVPK